MIRAGTNLGPFDAWLATRGARTLSVRVERQSANALALARFLEAHAAVERGVAFTPGNAFFADGGGERSLRLSFSAVPFGQIEEGVRRLADSIRELVRHPERSARERGPAVPLV